MTDTTDGEGSNKFKRVERWYDTEFVRLMDLDLEECADGVCVFTVKVQPKHLQHKGYVHGGVLSALIDQCGGTAGGSTVGDDNFVLTSDLHVTYLKPAKPPLVRFEGSVIKKGMRTIVSDVRVYNVSEKGKELCTVGRLSLAVIKIDNK